MFWKEKRQWTVHGACIFMQENRPKKKKCFGSIYCLVIGPISSSSSLVLNILTPPQWNLPIFIMCLLTVELKLLPSHTDLDHHLTLMITFQRDGSLRKILLGSKTGKSWEIYTSKEQRNYL